VVSCGNQASDALADLTMIRWLGEQKRKIARDSLPPASYGEMAGMSASSTQERLGLLFTPVESRSWNVTTKPKREAIRDCAAAM
jgi:hypothetical protein